MSDYKDTICLPKTSFPMKAKLSEREPKILENWKKTDLYGMLQKKREGAPVFTLYDGPPYANGHAHMGTALNKILKDLIIKFHSMRGFRVPFTPGWDCHGLPIEWKVEENYRAEGVDKDTISPVEFRAECRRFADSWLETQKSEFERLGVSGDWKNPYRTMDSHSEARIVEELHKFVMDGSLISGAKPVYWSVVEKTALAEAEIEYKDKVSPSVHVVFPVVSSKKKALEGTNVVIWTTTPWTLPSNRAVAYGEDITYVGVRPTALAEGSAGSTSQTYLVAKDLIESFTKDTGIESFEITNTFKGSDLEGSICHHPLKAEGYDFEVPLLPAVHVTTEQGTGLVHTAPSHGVEDYALGQAFNLEVPHNVLEDGAYAPHVPLFAGLHVFKANSPVMEALREKGALLSTNEISHSYPHSWRSKAPLILRASRQWFISMDKNGLREKALHEIKKVKWVPEQGQNRINSMVEGRPDWCLSRQRVWGIPIAIFVHKETGEILRDSKVNKTISSIFRKEGSDAWFRLSADAFLGEAYDAEKYEMVKDIVDVWFESGCVHAFVTESHPELLWPADVIIEGSDQHRGWFQSMLLEACGTKGKAPFKTVLTHGFVVDADGRKMSKSLKNTIDVQNFVEVHGADILRLWVASADYTDDLRIGNEIIKRQQDIYRRLRNFFRYLLGNLHDFNVETDLVEYEALPELEKWVLGRLHEVTSSVMTSLEGYNFNKLFNELYHLCTTDLSSYYFDIRKDALYCEGKDSLARKSVQTVLHHIFEVVTRLLAPIIPFTAEEVWKYRYGDNAESIHLEEFFEVPNTWDNEEILEKWSLLRKVRRVVTGALEKKRAEGYIGSSLQAHPVVYVTDERLEQIMDPTIFKDICIVSSLSVRCSDQSKGEFSLEEVDGVSVDIELAKGEKCTRCWKVEEDIGAIKEHPELCLRCAKAI